MEVTHKTGEAVEVDAGALNDFTAHLGFATVYGLQVEEVPQPVQDLFEAYRSDPSLLPPAWRVEDNHPVAVDRRIGDFIAGMTDRYAIAQKRHHVGPVTLPEGF